MTRNRVRATPRRAVRFFGALMLVGFVAGGAPAATIESPPAGTIETGATDFIVLGPESIGLSSPPTDLHELPSGAILVVAQDEIAIGDGVRWQTFRRAADAPEVRLNQVAVGADGTIYAGMENGFVRLELVNEGRWRPVPVVVFPAESELANRVLSSVTEVDGNWYWNGVSGSFASWRPGGEVKVLGRVNGVESVFGAMGGAYITDASSASTYRISPGGLEPMNVISDSHALRELVTSATPMDATSTLLGTNTQGIQVFDGRQVRQLAAGGILGGRHRINALCQVTDDWYAAAVDSVGVAFFTKDGLPRLVMDRALDHRLARVQRLFAGRGGAVWLLLSNGIARIGFPTRVTDFETKVSSGLAFSLLYRIGGELWLVSDGSAQRAVYDDGRLLRFDLDTPPGYVVSMFSHEELVLAGTEKGFFQHRDGEWKLAVAGVNKAHVCPTPDEEGRWFYAAIDEFGWLRWDGREVTAERHPWPGLGAVFVSVQRVGEDYWAELGAGRVGRIRPRKGGEPQVRIYTSAELGNDSWVQLFTVDGIARFNIDGQVLRHDPVTDRLHPDPDFLQLTDGIVAEHGRPARDASGRLWVTTRAGVHIVSRGSDGNEQAEAFEVPGIVPIQFTMQDDGVVWMHKRQRLTRFDPAFPRAPVEPLRALVGTVQLSGSRRDFHFVSGRLPVLDYEDNSLTLSLLAPGANPNLGVTFEVQLEGHGDKWESVGSGGVASLRQLKEGDYVVRVRPRTAYAVGETATLAFTVRPPWYRTWTAFVGYVIALVLAIVGTAAGWSYLARRKQRELARLVEIRTADLSRSEERYRRLAAELEERVVARTAALESSNRDLEVAIRDLENANRELETFSYSVSHDLRAPLRGIDGWSLALLEDYGGRLDATAREYLERVRRETQRLGGLIDDLLKLARTTRAELRLQSVDLSALAADIARRLADAKPDRKVEFHCAPGLVVQGDPRLLEAALSNLLDNAWKFSGKALQPRVEVGCNQGTDGSVFHVRDNGAGFDMRHAGKLFGVFQRMHTQGEFPGTGVGLATVQRVIHRHGGRIWAESNPGSETTFYFTVPAPAGTVPAVRSAHAA